MPTGGTYQACLMALKKDVGGTFTVGGSATVTASCGLGALSCEAGAIDRLVIRRQGVTTDSIVTCGTASTDQPAGQGDGQRHRCNNPFETLPAPSGNETAKSLNCPNG